MSAPEWPRHYFADYEVYQDGHAVAWGHVTHCARSATDFNAVAVVDALRDRAARGHDVNPGAVRLRFVTRL